MDAESSLEEIRNERLKDRFVKIGHMSEIIREYLTKSKNTSFCRRIGRNRPIALINGSDETVHHKPLPLSRGRLIAIRRVRGGHVLMRFKTRETPSVGSSSSV